jgi:hypothetical protein
MQPLSEQPNKPAIPIKRDKEIAIKEMEIQTVNRVISEQDLKTQFRQSERIIISSLERLASNPFSISEKIAEERGINTKDHTFPALDEFLKAYVRKGKALDRKGIKEDVDIVSAYFQAQIERAKISQSPSVLTK